MALLANESFLRGFVLRSDGTLAVTSSQVGAAQRNGFLRDADGRLVVQGA